jgi:L-alanine-DL-glutamate epimerase-like enolase superfamily enzyme
LECHPHNWGTVADMAVHFQLELALPNAYWFEMPFPAENTDRPFYKNKFRIDADGYVHASTAPGIGNPIDQDALDNITARIER